MGGPADWGWAQGQIQECSSQGSPKPAQGSVAGRGEGGGFEGGPTGSPRPFCHSEASGEGGRPDRRTRAAKRKAAIQLGSGAN